MSTYQMKYSLGIGVTPKCAGIAICYPGLVLMAVLKTSAQWENIFPAYDPILTAAQCGHTTCIQLKKKKKSKDTNSIV